MSKSRYPYAPDEFDAPMPQGAPVGVHRAPRSAWSRTWPFFLVALIFAGLAYAAFTIISGGTGTPSAGNGTTTAGSPTSEVSETPSDTDTGTGTEAPTNTDTGPTQAPTDTETTAEESTPSPTFGPPDFAQNVTVYNATGTVAGLAGAGTTVLKNAGYTRVTAADWPAARPKPLENSVVYKYPNRPELEATAHDVAQRLGITTVVLGAIEDFTGASTIQVVLVTDFRQNR